MSPDEGVLTLGWGKSGHIMEGVGCILYYIIFKDLFFFILLLNFKDRNEYIFRQENEAVY